MEIFKEPLTAFLAGGGLFGMGLLMGIFFGRKRKENDDDDFPEYIKDSNIRETLTVYSADGNIIKQYVGRFDIKNDDNCIIFEDEKGRNHEIYYSSGIIICDEEES